MKRYVIYILDCVTYEQASHFIRANDEMEAIQIAARSCKLLPKILFPLDISMQELHVEAEANYMVVTAIEIPEGF